VGLLDTAPACELAPEILDDPDALAEILDGDDLMEWAAEQYDPHAREPADWPAWCDDDRWVPPTGQASANPLAGWLASQGVRTRWLAPPSWRPSG
jgi:hypothetical protein